MKNKFPISGSGGYGRQHALAEAGQRLGAMLYGQHIKALNAPETSTGAKPSAESVIPEYTTRQHWLQAYGTLAVVMGRATYLKDLVAESSPDEFDDEGRNLRHLLEVHEITNHMYCDPCWGLLSALFGEEPNPLLDDEAWLKRATESLVRHHWAAVTVLAATLLDHDPRPNVVQGILDIRKMSHWRIKPRPKGRVATKVEKPVLRLV